MHALDPLVWGTPAKSASRSFSKNGTPVKGPSGKGSWTDLRARSNMGAITAFNCGLILSIRAMASSQSSTEDISFFFTSSANPKPSYRSYSLNPLIYSSPAGNRVNQLFLFMSGKPFYRPFNFQGRSSLSDLFFENQFQGASAPKV